MKWGRGNRTGRGMAAECVLTVAGWVAALYLLDRVFPEWMLEHGAWVLAAATGHMSYRVLSAMWILGYEKKPRSGGNVGMA